MNLLFEYVLSNAAVGAQLANPFGCCAFTAVCSNLTSAQAVSCSSKLQVFLLTQLARGFSQYFAQLLGKNSDIFQHTVSWATIDWMACLLSIILMIAVAISTKFASEGEYTPLPKLFFSLVSLINPPLPLTDACRAVCLRVQ